MFHPGVEVWIHKPAALGGIALVCFAWDGVRRVYVRSHLEVANGPAGGSLLEMAQSPDALLLEQMEAVLEDALPSDEGGRLVYKLGRTGLRIWRNVRSPRRERFV